MKSTGFRGVRGFLFVSALLGLLSLGGCSGSQGQQGPAGDQGPPGPPVVRGSATSLQVEVTGVTIGQPSTVAFKVTDQEGYGYAGIPVAALQVTVAQLVPGSNGDTSHWQNYINKVEQPDGVGPGTVPQVQATTDSGGTLTDNADGTYVYTFGTDLTQVATPVAVTFDSKLTHRVALALSTSSTYGLPPANNAIYTWQPSTGDRDCTETAPGTACTEQIDHRDIVDLASCNSCHNQLAMHGGSRKDVRMCVTCHNPGSTDANSGNTVDFRVLIHKLHEGKDLPSVVAGGDYAIWGYKDEKSDFSTVEFPQDIRNCTKCHDPANPNTPDAVNYSAAPSIQACGACHDDVNFAAGEDGGHPGGVVTDNSQCTVCHSEDRIAGSVEESHSIPAKVTGTHYQFHIVSISHTAPGQFPVVKYSVTDPTAHDSAYNVLSTTDLRWACVSGNLSAQCNDGVNVTKGGGSRLGIDIAWNNADYTNASAGTAVATGPSQALKLDGLLVNANNTAPVSNGDGTFTVTSLVAIPADATGSGTAVLEGHPAGDYDGDGSYTDRVPVTSAVSYFPITDSSAVARRVVIKVGNCEKCHDQLSVHGSNRTLASASEIAAGGLTNVPYLCVACHNPRDTDVGHHLTDAPDGLTEQSVDFKVMIHGIHGSGVEMGSTNIRQPGIVVSGTDFSTMAFPGIVARCDTCHLSTLQGDSVSTYQVPLASNVLSTTVSSGDASAPSIASQLDDLVTTPTAAVCSSCHNDPTAEAHMGQTGGALFSVPVGSVTVETCSVCHGPGTIADLDVVHGIK